MRFLDEMEIITLDDLGGQYCNRNCTGCSASFLATAGLSSSCTFTVLKKYSMCDLSV